MQIKLLSFTPLTRALTVLLLLTLTILYSSYQKDILFSYNDSADHLILKKLPSFNLETILDKKNISSLGSYDLDTNGLFVHLWATWCAPCEAELPFLIKFASKFENEGIKFLLVAVNDDPLKVKKFFKKIKNLPSNMIVALDKENKSMDLLGTIKVPETYLFNRQKKHIKKFVGPQNWEQYETGQIIRSYLTL